MRPKIQLGRKKKTKAAQAEKSPDNPRGLEPRRQNKQRAGTSQMFPSSYAPAMKRSYDAPNPRSPAEDSGEQSKSIQVNL